MTANDNSRIKITPLYLARKLRQKGVVYCVKAVLRIAGRSESRPDGYFGATLRFLINLFNYLFSRKPRKAILGVWDYKALPWSIGDLLVFIETLSVLKLKYGAEKINVCVVCDRENPSGNRGSKNINSSKFRNDIVDLLPLIGTSPYLGSVFHFD